MLMCKICCSFSLPEQVSKKIIISFKDKPINYMYTCLQVPAKEKMREKKKK